MEVFRSFSHGFGQTNYMMRYFAFIAFALVFLCTGCEQPAAVKDSGYGRTWYIDGAGNWGFGVNDVPKGLKDAGYRGTVANHRWSITLNPVLDQTLRFVARGSAKGLASEITKYLKANPKADVNIIALSAGTGVGAWAIENVEPPCKVNNFILLGSSLSSRYDIRKALDNMKGHVYVYYASADPILQGPVRALGTIDGTFDDSAGLVGLRGPAYAGRVINIGWSSRYTSLGWTGGHADCTNHKFVQQELARWIISPVTGQESQPQHASHQAELSNVESTWSELIKMKTFAAHHSNGASLICALP